MKFLKTAKTSLLILVIITSVFVFYKNSELKNENVYKVCGRYPEQKDIFVDNIIWQVLETSSGFFYLLNAFLDTRFERKQVRVLAILPTKRPTVFCQFWYDDDTSKPEVVKAGVFETTFRYSKFL